MAKFKRKLTPFLCQELLYDYATGQLDNDRKAAVEEFLRGDQECQRILDSIHKGIEYADKLSATQLKPETLKTLRESENAISLGRRYSSWKQWPEAVRWSLTAIVISSAVAATVAVIPWNRLPNFKGKKSDVIEIAQLTNGNRPVDDNYEPQPGEAVADEGSGDEEIEPPESAPAPTPTPTPKPARRTDIARQLPAATHADEDPDENMSKDPETESRKETKPKGFVYRAFMSLSQLEEIGPKITDNIIELGGEKAGEVELGWKRGTGRYYHFTLPSDNEERLLEKLRGYGPVRISKDPHPRVMPEGQVRFILWVESTSR